MAANGLLMVDSGPLSIKEENSLMTESKSMELDTVEKLQSAKLNHSPIKVHDLNHSPYKGDKKHLAYEDILSELKGRIERLLHNEDFTLNSTRVDLKFLQKQTRYNPDVVLNRRLVEQMVKFGVGHVFLKVWRSVNSIDYMVPDNYLAFKNLQTVLSVVWNCSDKSSQFCESLSMCGVIQLFLTELNTPRLLKAEFGDENLLYLAKAYLGILHNIVRLSSDSRKLFRSSHALEILKNYLYIDQFMVKTKAYLILSYIITEEENEVINATDENIEFIIVILKDALNSENHFSQKYAFWATEIACGLNHLARNDTNKIRIARLGGLSLYCQMLSSTVVEEQNLGTAGLWILSFHDDNKRLIRTEPGCLDGLQQLATTSNEESVRRAARGALWVIKLSQPEKPPSIHEMSMLNSAPHVMISYHWASQKSMIKVKNKLKTAGFKVWMDVDNMRGSTLEAMALAVEQASVVLVCMTQAYKDSPNCRTEAEYIYRLRKDLIPLVLQTGYDPDGWLGMLVGTRLYFDFSEDKNFETEGARLIKELGNRGKIPTSRSTSVMSSRSDDSSALSPRSAMSDSTSCSSLHGYMNKTAAISNWSCDDVRVWLEGCCLSQFADKFKDFTGELLIQFKKMQKSAPEHFYSTLETKLGLDLIMQLKFTKALDDLI